MDHLFLVAGHAHDDVRLPDAVEDEGARGRPLLRRRLLQGEEEGESAGGGAKVPQELRHRTHRVLEKPVGWVAAELWVGGTNVFLTELCKIPHTRFVFSSMGAMSSE